MPLVCSCQVTVVSVASPTSGASQKSVALPVNVALGQQILTVQQSTSVSPVKVATSQSTTQVTWKHRTVSCSWYHLIWGEKRNLKKTKNVFTLFVHKCHFSSVWESRSCSILLWCAVMLFSSSLLSCSWVHLILLLHTNRPHLGLSWQEAGEDGDNSLLLQVQFYKNRTKPPKLPNKHYTDEWKQTWSKHAVKSCGKIKIEWNGFFCAMLALEIIIAAV